MINKLPLWNVNNLMPAFNDLESASVLDMTGKIYKKINELIEEHNVFITEINNRIDAFESSTNKDFECFKAEITKIIHDYIIAIDSKIDHQDRVIAESITYIKENISATVIDVVNQMKESGELTEELTKAFDELGARVVSLETKVTKLENTTYISNYDEENKTLIIEKITN